MTTWKPGDVAMGNGGRVLLRMEAHAAGCSHPGSDIGHWHNHHQHIADFSVVAKGARPLVVIDPEDREQVERLSEAFGECDHAAECVTCLQAALREFANPTPAKPEEPTGLGAVVEDSRSLKWVRLHPGGEAWINQYGRSDAWSDIDVARVLSEGVTE